VTIAFIGTVDPVTNLSLVAVMATVIAVFSASQDVAIDAYRRELLSDDELGLGNSVHVQAYRISSLIPGSLAIVLADSLPWHLVFWITAGFMSIGVGLSLSIKEPSRTPVVHKNIYSVVVTPFADYVERRGWAGVLLAMTFMVLYKLGDNMATALSSPFYLDLGFTKTEIGVWAKNAGLWSSIIGAMIGGAIMLRVSINKALWLFGTVQLLSIGGFAILAATGPVIWLLAAVISFEYLGVGLGTAAFVAYMARESSRTFAATQIALFTALAALPRSMANASTGFLVESLGWVEFYLLCMVAAVPGMLLLLWVAPWGADHGPDEPMTPDNEHRGTVEPFRDRDASP
jgi:PAT family beta-lactamase induction signal transducer AmpG